MAESRLKTIYEFTKPPLVRAALAVFGVVSGYDALSSQLEWPNIRKIWGVSGSLLPWWGWLLILQAVLGYALFEYVRQSIPASALDDVPPEGGLDVRVIASRITPIQNHVASILERLDGIERQVTDIPSEIENKKLEILRQITDYRKTSELRENCLADLQRITTLKIRGLLVLSSITPRAAETSEWAGIKERVMAFGRDVTYLDYQFDREGLHLPYFTGENQGRRANNEQEQRSMEYDGHVGYVKAAISRLDEAEAQAFERGAFTR